MPRGKGVLRTQNPFLHLLVGRYSTVAANGPLSYLALRADFSADEVRGGLTDPFFIRGDRQDRQHQSHLSIRVPFITGKALLVQRLTRLGVLIVAESVEPTLPRFAALPCPARNGSQ